MKPKSNITLNPPSAPYAPDYVSSGDKDEIQVAPRMPRCTPDGSLVYLIGERGTSLFKIGFTKNLEPRLADLQCGNPRRLYVMYALWGSRRAEEWLASKFHSWHRYNEWYSRNHSDAIERADSLAQHYYEASGLPPAKTSALREIYN